MGEKAERIVEFDLANERVVLATMAQEPGARRRLVRELRAKEFGDPKHQVIFRALQAMDKGGLKWSEDTLRDLSGQDDFGGFEYVRALLEEYEPARNLDYHVERLRLDAVKFMIMRDDLPEIAGACQEPKAPPAELARLLRGAAARVEHMGRDFSLRGQDLRAEYIETLRMRRAVGNHVEGTGFRILDQGLTRGFVPGLSVVTGRPGHGKSTWLANLIRRRVDQRRATYVCGWEMSRDDYLDMMVSGETGIPGNDIALRLDELTEAQQREIFESIKRFTDPEIPMAIEESPFFHLPKPEKHWEFTERNLDYLEMVISRNADDFPLFAIDVFNKMIPDKRPDTIAMALVRIREMARGHNVHVMLLHHLNREGAEGRPTLQHIKGSGAFEEEADLIFAMDRPILRASPTRRRKMHDVLDVHVLKQRKGPAPFCVRYQFDGSRYSLSGETELDISILEHEDDDGMEG